MTVTVAASSLLERVVAIHGIRLGVPVDILFDRQLASALGFEVRTPGNAHRFLPWVACDLRRDSRALEVDSLLTLLSPSELSYYRERALSFRSLVRWPVRRGDRKLGAIADVMVTEDAAVRHVVVAREDRRMMVEVHDLRLDNGVFGAPRAVLSHARRLRQDAGGLE